MGDPIYIDTQGIENSVYNAIVESMPDLTPLVRAAYVFELNAVEKRLEPFGGHTAIQHEDETFLVREADSAAVVDALWRRRQELRGLLWPPLDAPANGGVATDLQKAADEGMGC